MEDKINNRFKKNFLANIKSNYVLQQICSQIQEKRLFKIVKYNKNIQNRLNIDKNDYKTYKSIFIEIIPINIEDKNVFIRYSKEEEKYYHFYFNDEKEDKKRNYFYKDENVTKIKIIVDYQTKSFVALFNDVDCIKKINFIKFKRNDITNMSYMFYNCSSLEELNLNNFNTNNVTNMYGMFEGCSLLKELNLNNFNTNNVTNMCGMFEGCSSLEELNLNNFNTNKVTDM